MTEKTEIITIQFRVPKRHVNTFNEFIKNKGMGITANSFVKDLVVRWMDKTLNQPKENNNG
jgi:hypothetical protein